MIKAILFDLDGTLLPFNENEFVQTYFTLLSNYVSKYGYEPQQLIATIWGGTKAMYKNDGCKTNEEVFWDYFKEIYGEEKLQDKKLFDSFYVTEFQKTKSLCCENKEAKKIIDYVNKNVKYTILSTNPIFPRSGTLTRMSFIGLKEEDFSYITSYENCHYTKPNPKYFEEILQKFSLLPNEVIMFGNNTYEDGECSSKAGIKAYMVGDYIIKSDKTSLQFCEIKMSDVIDTIEKELQNNKNLEG